MLKFRQLERHKRSRGVQGEMPRCWKYSQPELKFTKEANAEVVDTDDQYQEDSNPYSGIHPVTGQPELDHQSSGGKLVRRKDDVLQPVTVCDGAHMLAILRICELSGGLEQAYVQPRANPSEGSQKRDA